MGAGMVTHAMVDPSAVVRCTFYARHPREGGQFEYENISVASYNYNGHLTTPCPPAMGDLVYLWDQYEEKGGSFRVLERFWTHASYGSMHWPYKQQLPITGPELIIIVELTTGPFRNEVPVPPEDGEVKNVRYQIGCGGDGTDQSIPECPLCYARGGGGHGGFCPNSGKTPGQWVTELPPRHERPRRPEGRMIWAST